MATHTLMYTIQSHFTAVKRFDFQAGRCRGEVLARDDKASSVTCATRLQQLNSCVISCSSSLHWPRGLRRHRPLPNALARARDRRRRAVGPRRAPILHKSAPPSPTPRRAALPTPLPAPRRQLRRGARGRRRHDDVLGRRARRAAATCAWASRSSCRARGAVRAALPAGLRLAGGRGAHRGVERRQASVGDASPASASSSHCPRSAALCCFEMDGCPVADAIPISLRSARARALSSHARAAVGARRRRFRRHHAPPPPLPTYPPDGPASSGGSAAAVAIGGSAARSPLPTRGCRRTSTRSSRG